MIKNRLWMIFLAGVLGWVILPPAELNAGSGAETTRPKLSPRNGDLERVAKRLYRKAIKEFENQEYWKATRDLIIILDFYSTYSEIDGVVFYLGESLYEMDMFKSSTKMYKYLLKQYPSSKYLPKALFGLQRIYYNTNELDESLKYFRGISTRFRDSEVLDGAYYYGGMAYYHKDDFTNAIRAIGKVRSRSEFYDYSLYTVGLAFLKKKNIENAVKAMRKLISLPVIRSERLDLQRAAHLTLGYLYYELGYYRESIKHFASIPPDDEIYAEALLARSWSAIKLNDFQQAIISLNRLIKKSDDDKFGEEAHFLLGQCYLELGFYDFAIQQFDFIIDRYPATNNIERRIARVEEGMEQNKQMAENLRVQLLLLETKLLDMIPFPSKDVPKYIKHEHERVNRTRENLIKKILEERKLFDEFRWSVEKIREEIFIKRSRKHWRAYAEYGKARAYFLKTMPTR
ncbi:MAG TPA: tetratricopeptide repeat protein [Bacteroidetes bacterium]|nr:tetratricopeptide repeat protein [Bacteroidota bacterium]